jgi:hypothetical protein
MTRRSTQTMRDLKVNYLLTSFHIYLVIVLINITLTIIICVFKLFLNYVYIMKGNDYPEEEDHRYSDNDDSDNDDDDDSDDDDSYDKALPRFDRKRIGRVILPQLSDEYSSSDAMNMLLPIPQQEGGLNKLWGYDDDNSDDEGGGRTNLTAEHDKRLKNMKLTSGLKFASNVNQFDNNGLAKYTGDLSDDEIDEAILINAYKCSKRNGVDSSSNRVNDDELREYAYDSDMDGSVEDDGDGNY